ncbi:MAG: hypothetical protein N2Z21_00260 [Candidatus Sumerlaeaceae bacterium]|nr:hypothetical protein [Candidatus Sumerlaeaceae bacterium]
MTYKKGKQQFTKEEIIEILRRNVNLFKDEDEFVDYIVELALYLVEHRMQTQTEASDATLPGKKTAPQPEEVFEKRQEPFQRSAFWQNVSDVRDLLERQVREPAEELTMCLICGATVPKKAKICPICGSMM